ncbi:MAG: methyltransferase domain-containing protein [Burkholderiales bacterium]|nr:methyltransferase domain-containing protein [Burkholderiales bacterium]OJX04175.1 MAG: hypothetical protein BGO72_11855 [Burkholderiales bacterium 70-64]
MQLKARSIAKGLATQVPFLARYANSRAAAEVTGRYYYSVWLRHLRQVSHVCKDTNPKCVAELGPGDSLGLGLAAMLSGADRYYALDRLRFATSSRNLAILDELIELFRARAPIPGDDELPNVHPRLDDYRFPTDLLDGARLDRALESSRLQRIRRIVAGNRESDDELQIRYFAPWDDAAEVMPESVDWVLSQAVLEHVDDVPDAYENLMRWLRPGGLMSHRIDYSSHGITRDWNGHWTVSDLMWRLVRGQRAYLINRLPHSAHLQALKRSGFSILLDFRTEGTPLARELLPKPFQSFTSEDLGTTGAFIVARK